MSTFCEEVCYKKTKNYRNQLLFINSMRQEKLCRHGVGGGKAPSHTSGPSFSYWKKTQRTVRKSPHLLSWDVRKLEGNGWDQWVKGDKLQPAESCLPITAILKLLLGGHSQIFLVLLTLISSQIFIITLSQGKLFLLLKASLVGCIHHSLETGNCQEH